MHKILYSKKNDRVAAIPAQTTQLNEHKNKGFKCVEVIATCDKSDALNRYPKHNKKRKNWLVLCSILLVIAVTLSLVSAIFSLIAK